MSKYGNQLKPLSLTINILGNPSIDQCWMVHYPYRCGLQPQKHPLLAQGEWWISMNSNQVTEAYLLLSLSLWVAGNCLKVEPLYLVHAGMYIQGWMGGLCVCTSVFILQLTCPCVEQS